MTSLRLRRRMLLAGLVAGLAMPRAACAGASARRIVSIGPAVSETVVALGAVDRLVGVDTASQYPALLQRLPQVGYLRAISAEGVLSLRPDLVLISADAGPPTAVAQLRAVGVPVVSMAVGHSPDATLAMILRVGEAIDRRGDGEALAGRVRHAFEAVASAITARQGKPRVLFVLATSGGSVMASGRDTAADAMVGLAGGRNAVDGYSGYKALTPEAALAAVPDLVLLPSHAVTALGGLEQAKAVPSLALTPAVRAGRVVVMDSAFLLGFGPRTPRAVAALAHELYPNLALPELSL